MGDGARFASCQSDDADLWPSCLDRSGRGQAVFAGQIDVHHDHVWRLRFDHRIGRSGVGGIGGNLETFFALEAEAQAGADEFVVVDDGDSDGHGGNRGQ